MAKQTYLAYNGSRKNSKMYINTRDNIKFILSSQNIYVVSNKYMFM